MTVERELWERVLGHAAAAVIEGIQGSGFLETIVQNDAIKLLQKIQDILDDESLNDFQCVEEIVCLFERAGISTDRHDFG